MKRSILIALLSFMLGIMNYAESKVIKNTIQQKDTSYIDKEKYLPKKLLISTLPDDYPKELDELFKFYFKLVHNLTNVKNDKKEFYYDRKTYINKLPLPKLYRLRYLIWLAWNSIPKYYAEYIKINSGIRIGNFSFEEIRGKSILADKFGNGYFFDNLVYPKVGAINAKIFNMIREKYAEKLKIINPMYETRDKIYIKGKILKKKLVYVNYRNKYEKIPFYFLKVRVLDAIGNQFKEKEIILFVGIFESLWLEKIISIEIDKEYFFPISVTATKPYIKNTIYFDGKKLNRSLYYFVPVNAFSIIENDELIGYIPRQFRMFKKEGENIRYQAIKKEIESEIKFLKFLSSKTKDMQYSNSETKEKQIKNSGSSNR